VTCEITNDRDTAELKLVKKVTGGNQLPNDWTLAADATAPLNDKNFSNLGGQGTFKSVYSGINYTLSETGPANYSQTGDWKCVDKDLKPVTVTGGNTVKLDKNAEVTCTVTNDATSAELKLVKKVTGDNRQAAGRLEPDAPTRSLLRTDNFTVKGDADTCNRVLRHAYTLTETGPGDYTASDWSVKDGTATGDRHRRQGQGGKEREVTCEITNDRNTAELKLVKKVTGDNGAKGSRRLDPQGRRAPHRWTTRTSPTSVVRERSSPSTAAREYTLSETGPGDYTASDWVCKTETNVTRHRHDGKVKVGKDRR
jgi:hypothetical protein